MVGLTPHSIIWVCVVSCIFILILIIFSTNTTAVSGIPMWLTISVFAIVVFRLSLPIEYLNISKTIVIYQILPQIYSILTYKWYTLFKFDISILNILYLIWGIGAIYNFIAFLFINISAYITVKFTPQSYGRSYDILQSLKKELNCNFKVRLIKSMPIPTPQEYGYWTNTIFLDDFDYTEKELRYILTHELFHYKYNTHWLKLLADLTSIFFWWNPLIVLLKRHIYDKIEIFVDLMLLNKLPNADKNEYIDIIKKASKNLQETTNNAPLTLSSLSSSNEETINQRIAIIQNNSKTNIPMCLVIVALTFMYLFVSCRYIVQPGWKPSYKSTSNHEFSEFNDSNSYILVQGDKYILYYNGESFAEIEDPNNFPDVPIIQP